MLLCNFWKKMLSKLPKSTQTQPPNSMEILLKNLNKIRLPTENDVVYKDECVYSFDNAESKTGIYVNLNSFLGFAEDYAERYAEKTGNVVFLHIRRLKTLKNGEASGSSSAKNEDTKSKTKITRLAIGLEGGFNETDKYEYEDTYSVVVFTKVDEVRLPYPNIMLPPEVCCAVEAVLLSEAAIEKLKKQTITGTWDGEVRQVSKYSENLIQLDNGKKIPPSGWKCEKCELTSNLWLNLTDGSILCGRKFFDGSGGNDHAVEHFKTYGYPLAVKLGTISAEAKPDVFSYAEDEMVIDSKLEEHLAHFGIHMAAMKKIEKSMVEMELEINQRVGEWKLLTECDSELQPLTGRGYTGMRNLGNSCYMNSVMQVLFTVPDFIERYVEDCGETYFAAFPPDPANDFNIQMAKLGNGLWSGKYCNQNGIVPTMFKAAMGKHHADFSTKQQQDAYEYFLHMINMLESHTTWEKNPSDAFSFLIEERIECMSSKKVKYNYREEHCLPLMIPIDEAINIGEIFVDSVLGKDKEAERISVPFEACVESFLAPEIIEQFYSSAINDLTLAEKTTRLSTMPDFLMIHLLKFTLGQDWLPQKLNVSIDMPDKLNICDWRGTGLQPNEELLPETAEPGQLALTEFVYNDTILSELISMGFTQEASQRALFYTKNAGVEAASEWLMEHFADPDVNDPFVLPVYSKKRVIACTAYKPDQQKLTQLMGMGFDERLATKALEATDGNVEHATEWILEHMNDPEVNEQNKITCKRGPKSYRDGDGKYKLVAFISHMGHTAQAGHYVCHILKNGHWVIFNDEKVALSQAPPKNLGYLYLYKREE